jgi:methionyl-tRNA formyltransferase
MTTMQTKALQDIRIIFMGTPEFAVASLDRLVGAGCRVVAVVTAPDKAAGRGLTLQQSPVKKYAQDKNIPVLQPEKLKNPDFLETLRSYEADLQVVVAFRMLPEIVWNMPPLGTINVHGSLLPQYRGAAPINWAIINGEPFTGVTTFKLKHDIDTGNILLSKKIDIREDETAGELHDEMKETGADLLLETLEKLAAGQLVEKPQETMLPGNELRHAPKIFTETCRINWNKPLNEIYNLVRGLSPYPAAFTELDGKKLKIFSAKKIPGTTSQPGIMETDKRTYLRFTCPDGMLDILSLQLEGKKRMDTADFLRGYRFEEN